MTLEEFKNTFEIKPLAVENHSPGGQQTGMSIPRRWSAYSELFDVRLEIRMRSDNRSHKTLLDIIEHIYVFKLY